MENYSFFSAALSAAWSLARWSRRSWIARHPTVNNAPCRPLVMMRVFKPRPKNPMRPSLAIICLAAYFYAKMMSKSNDLNDFFENFTKFV